MTTLRAERLGFVSMYVKDVDVSTEFYEKAVHLEVSDRRNGKVFFRGGVQHHWIVVQPTPEGREPGLARLGIEVAGRETLDAFEARLLGLGLDVDAGDGLADERVMHYLKFDDPSGNPLMLYTDMVQLATKPKPRLVEFLDVQHVVLAVHDIDVGHDFYTNVLGMRVSDWFEHSTAFMHFRNGWHHGIGIGSRSGNRNGLQHICFHTPDLDATMRSRAAVKKLGLPITSDLLKHGPSGSTGFYYQGPDTIIENSFGARWFDPDQEPTVRIIATRRESGDVYQTGLEDLELAQSPESGSEREATAAG